MNLECAFGFGFAVDFLFVDFCDLEFNQAVVYEDALAFFDVFVKCFMGKGDFVFAVSFPRCEDDFLSFFNGDSFRGECAEADFWALEILEEADCSFVFAGCFTNVIGDLAEVFV